MTVAMTGVHRGRFGSAMDEFRRRRGEEPDRAWRALLLLTTAAPGFWERVREHIDWERMSFDPAAIPVASFDETRLLRVAVNLLQDDAAVDVRDLADNMDGALWRVVMLAWEEYQKLSRRGG